MSSFTEEQTAAIARRSAPTLVDAGAGSGKTSVLVERFVRAVLEDGVDPRSILAITFTEKAAGELRERVRAALGAAGAQEAAEATEEGWISTIHAFCARVLRSDPLAAGIDPEFRVLDADDAQQLSDAAFEQALAEVAETSAGSELIAASRPYELRAAVTSAYAELRARGQREPQLPMPAAEQPTGGERAAVVAAAAAAAQELALVPDPGVAITRALDTLARVETMLGREELWPGELDGLLLRNGAGALRTETCERYRDALATLRGLLAGRLAAVQLAALNQLLARYGACYLELKRGAGALDFDDLELLARDVLAQPEIGDRYRARFTHVMVDELQDSSAVQLELVDLLTGSGEAVAFMVGDAQQSIYGFRHAEVEQFEARGKALEQAGGRLSLRTNFRTRAEILEVINAGFEAVLGERFRPLRPGRSDPAVSEPLVELIVIDKGLEWEDDTALAAPWRAAEARVLAARIAELIASGQYRPADVVVLTRATTDLRVYERALEALAVPTFVVGGRGYWRHPQVIELAAYLRALANPLDQEQLWTVLSSPLCGLSLDGLVLVAAGARDQLAGPDADRLDRFETWFTAERARAELLGPSELLERAIAATGYDLSVVAHPDGIRRLANVRKLLRLAREFEAQHGPGLDGFVALLSRRMAGWGPAGAKEAEAPVESESLDAVRLMTIHRSKGLEFPVVCVADLGRAPVYRAPLLRLGRRDERIGVRIGRPGTGARVSALAYDELRLEEDRRELDEAKRLFYVAMTRARERLILSGAAKLEKLGNSESVPMDWIATAFKDLPGVAYRPVTDNASGACAPVGEPAVPALQEGPPAPRPEPLRLSSRLAVESVSYSGISQYARCGLRFRAERILGLPSLAVEAQGGRERGIRLHEALRSLDFARPAGVEPELARFLASETAQRLAAATHLQREQSFAFELDGVLVTGVFDVLAGSLVVDYKSDRLEGRTPEQLVQQRYELQRLIYATAALRSGAPNVEVIHLFLERPDQPASRIYAQHELAALEDELREAMRGLLAGDFRAAEEPYAGLCAGCPAAGGLCPHPLALTRRAAPDRLF